MIVSSFASRLCSHWFIWFEESGTGVRNRWCFCSGLAESLPYFFLCGRWKSHFSGMYPDSINTHLMFMLYSQPARIYFSLQFAAGIEKNCTGKVFNDVCFSCASYHVMDDDALGCTWQIRGQCCLIICLIEIRRLSAKAVFFSLWCNTYFLFFLFSLTKCWCSLWMPGWIEVRKRVPPGMRQSMWHKSTRNNIC